MTDSKYIAFVTPDSKDRGQTASKDNVGSHIYLNDHKYTSTKVYTPNGDPVYYWVRDGYTIKLEEDTRFQGADKSYVVRAYKSASADTGDIVQSYQNDIKESNIYTISGDKLHNTNTGVYAGGSNGYTPVRMFEYEQGNDRNDPWIEKNGEWQATDWDDFKSVTLNSTTGLYEYKGQVVNPENVYVIQRNDRYGNKTNQIGVFVVDDQVYTGAVHGSNNEVLMTAIGTDGKYYTYWASEVYDPTATIGTMTVSTFNKRLSDIEADITTVHKDDVKEIEVKPAEGSSSNGGTIGLEINNDFYEDGSPTGGKYIPGTITIKNPTIDSGIDSGTNGEDVKIQFGSIGEDGKTDVAKFTVDAGSKVVGRVTENGSKEDAGVNDANKTLTGLKINGVEYDLSQGKTYTKGNGIAISTDETTGDNTISVDLAKDGQTNVSGLHFNATGQLANNLSIKEATPVEGETHSNKGNWSIIEDTGDGTTKTFTNTTLDSTASETANEEAEENSTYVDKDTETSKVTTTYGRDYVVKDTDGNEVELKDIASASTLKDIDINKIGDLQYSEVINEEDPNYDPNTDLTIEDDDSLTVAVGKLDNRVTNNTTSIENLTQTVNEGWTAQAGEDSIKVTPKDGKNTLKFAGDNNITVSANKDISTIQVGLENDVYLGGNNTEENNNIALNGSTGNIKATAQAGIGRTNTFEFNSRGAMFTNKSPSAETSTNINGGTITVNSGENRKTTITGSSVNAGDVKINSTSGGEGTIVGLSNLEWGDDEKAAVSASIESTDKVEASKAATQAQLLAATNEISDFAVKYDPDATDPTKPNYNKVTLGNEKYDFVTKTGGTTITNLRPGDISATSTEAVNGSQLYSVQQEAEKHTEITVNGGVSAPTDGSYTNDGEGHLDGNLLLKQSEGTNGQTVYDLKLNPDITLQSEDDKLETQDNRVELSGSNGTIMATTDFNDMSATTTINGGNVYVGNSVSVGDKVVMTNEDITGLSNTTWDGKTDDESRAATEGQLKTVSDTVNAGWTATDSDGKSIVVNPENGSTLNFAGDRNIEVKANEKDGSIDVSLKDDIVLGGKEDTSRVEIGGTNGTIMATKDPNSMAATTTIDGGNVYVGSSISVGDKVEITDKDITGLSNTEWNGTTTTPDRAATEGQLQQVSNDVNAGWIATDNNGSQVNITPDNNKLNFAGDENVTVTAANNEIKVALKDDIVLGDYLNGDDGVLIGGSSGTISATNSITVGEDQGLIIDGQKKEIQGLSNTTWNEKIANDAAVEGSTAASTAATQGQLQEVSKVANAGWTASDGTNSISVKPNETLTFVGDENLTVSADGTDKELKVSLNDDITLKGDSSSIELTGTKGTIQVNQETAEGTNFTNINGNVVSIGYTNSEGIENAIVIDGGKGTITGLSNTTWDDELATQVANSEELQGTAATQGQLQQAVSEVAEVANAGWNAKAGGNTINVKPNETLNFEGDGNITVSATGGTSNELKFGLNDDITLGNPKAGNTEGERSFTINTTDPEGYVPDSYKEENSSGAEFIKENGGFMLFATDTQGHGIFGVTAKGSAWAKDFKTYTTDIYGNNTQYSLNDVGDAVAQMSSYYNKENGKSYTVFSRYLNEAEKDNPFETVDGATRDIPLALRDDGAVLIGATIKDDDFTDNGIRINAETDADGNNKATITGLENTEWKPPTPVATLAANDGSATVTSRAATESQLNDLYSAVAAYDVNVDGTIDYSHIALAGAPYGASRAGNGTPTGGTSITNVAYASGKDGSEAVNVDYLNDAISDAAENGSISTSDQHLVANTETGSNGVYKPNDDGNVNLIVSDEKGNSSTITIGDVASKTELDSLKTNVGDLNYDKVTGDKLVNGDSVTTAIGKLDNKIDNISGTATDADNNTVTGGKINSDGTISLTQKDKDSIKLEGQLTDSGVVQEGTSFDKETGTITITSQDKYSGETSSVKVEGIASTEVVGATNKEDLATAYKDADKDGNATTEYITDSESMVEADVALDHAIQDVAGTSYANDMVLSNRIDSVEKRLGNVEERIDKVGAMAAAIANLRTMGFDPEAPTEIAIGVGQYKSETGIAIGVFHYPNQDFMLSASLSSSGDELMGGIGATWKLGRKSAAERAKDEEARHLEQAEEMKKLAQQEKVKAQAQRHAKLLAERQQASQKNA